jgi:hypothetical protein
MKGGAVMLERSPETVARKERKSFRAERLEILERRDVRTVILAGCLWGGGLVVWLGVCEEGDEVGEWACQQTVGKYYRSIGNVYGRNIKEPSTCERATTEHTHLESFPMLAVLL